MYLLWCMMIDNCCWLMPPHHSYHIIMPSASPARPKGIFLYNFIQYGRYQYQQVWYQYLVPYHTCWMVWYQVANNKQEGCWLPSISHILKSFQKYTCTLRTTMYLFSEFHIFYSRNVSRMSVCKSIIIGGM